MRTPHLWCIVEFKDREAYPEGRFRVLGSWRGGYLDGDSWRINSGITKVVTEGDYYFFYGLSGSVYRCHKNRYGASGFTMSVLANLKKQTPIEILDERDDWTKFEFLG